MKNNLVEHFIKTATFNGDTYPVIIQKMNDTLNSNYKSNTLSDWLKTRPVPNTVRAYMLRIALPDILYKYGLKIDSSDIEFINTLVQALSPPEKTAPKKRVTMRIQKGQMNCQSLKMIFH